MKISIHLLAAFFYLTACNPTEAQEGNVSAPQVMPKEMASTNTPNPSRDVPKEAPVKAVTPKAAKLEGMDYPKARLAILGYGWKPVSGNCGGGGTDDIVCTTYPETGNCSGTGVGYCDMMFVKEQRCLSIVTTGGPPGDGAVVDTVMFKAAPCSKNP